MKHLFDFLLLMLAGGVDAITRDAREAVRIARVLAEAWAECLAEIPSLETT